MSFSVSTGLRKIALHHYSITSKGKMHHGEKSEILDCIVPKDLEQDKPITTAAVLDGAVIVQMLRPRNSVTFGDCITNELWPYIRSWMENNDRVDIVWDIYSKYSLKTGTREKRSGGTRRRVTLHTKIPGNWAEFLRVDLNKQELFVEIAKTLSLMELPEEKQLFNTLLDGCITSPSNVDVSAVAPCTQEEADSRIFLHVAAAASAGHRSIIIRTTDSDVVVLGVAAYVSLKDKMGELWKAFGVGKNYRYLPIHRIAEGLGQKAAALPAFHAITGCDTTSSFFGKGKTTAWSVWQDLPGLTVPLTLLSTANPTEQILINYSALLQKFVVNLYGLSESEIESVDDARHYLFLKKGKDFVQMPPGSDAFYQHLLRAAHQSGYVWGNMLKKAPADASHSITDWGWQQLSVDEAPTPMFTTIPLLSKSLPELVSCKCKSVCKPPCSCCMHGQSCMILCACKGECKQNTTF